MNDDELGEQFHANAYDALAGGEGSQWAFGADLLSGDDPLAGVETGVPEGIDASALAAYSLMLGDDALIYSHRLAEWTSNAPDLEEDIALANIALDLLGQARLLLARAAGADPALVPTLADGSPVPPEDALAFFRDEAAFRNVRMVEAENGDFAVTLTRLLIFSTYRLALFQRLAHSSDTVLSAVAVKGVKELTYHRNYAGRWFLTLAQGTEESRHRLIAALRIVWPAYAELFRAHPIERDLARQGAGVDPTAISEEVDVLLEQVFSISDVNRPEVPEMGRVGGGAGREGRHTEAMGLLLAEMQVVARAHPSGRW